MSHTRTEQGQLVVVEWGRPEAEDVPEVLGVVKRLHRTAGAPVEYIAILGNETASGLQSGGREVLDALTRELLPYVNHLAVVLEASGFGGSILRSALTAATMLDRARRGVVTFSSTVEEAADNIAASQAQKKLIVQTVREVRRRHAGAA